MNKGVYESDSLFSLIHSSKNVEYVYLILLGVNSFMENYDQSMSDVLCVKCDEQKTALMFKEVTIKNIEMYNISTNQ